YIPLVDLDHDGRPEIVSVKSSNSGWSTYGAGVWRIANDAPLHESEDSHTSTLFTRSLESIYFDPLLPSPLFGSNADQCGATGPGGSWPQPRRIEVVAQNLRAAATQQLDGFARQATWMTAEMVAHSRATINQNLRQTSPLMSTLSTMIAATPT